MFRLNIVCPRCGGKVMSEILSSSVIDFACVHCAKRWFVKKTIWARFEAKLKKEYEGKGITSATGRKLLPT